jgi:hypothetical protein
MLVMLEDYLRMTKLVDMKGSAVQGLYLSSWMNSYALALAVHQYLHNFGLLTRVVVFLYVDNIQCFAPVELQALCTQAILAAVESIGCSVKEDAGFCSWKNPLANLSDIVTRDQTASQKSTWVSTANNPHTHYVNELVDSSITISTPGAPLWNIALTELVEMGERYSE